jgi:hypothetical protein
VDSAGESAFAYASRRSRSPGTRFKWPTGRSIQKELITDILKRKFQLDLMVYFECKVPFLKSIHLKENTNTFNKLNLTNFR